MVETKPTVVKPADDFIGLQDLWGLFFPRWRWFVLSLVVALGVATLYLMRTPNIYTRSASILVKDDSKGGGSAGAAMSEFNDLGIFKNNTNINNELQTLKSPTLMTEVVKRLGLNEVYTMREGLKSVELYKTSPCWVTFGQPSDQSLSFVIHIQSPTEVTLDDWTLDGESLDETYSVTLGDSVQTAVGSLVVTATAAFQNDWVGKKVRYTRGSVRSYTDRYTAALQANLSNKEATIIDLSIDDVSIQKAEDILNTLIEVYNEKWVLDKNQIAISTSKFISDRLGVIETELGHVDENISSYKSQHLLPDVQAASSLYMTQSAEYKKQLQALSNQLSTAQYIRRELSGKQIDQPLPSNSGISSGNIEGQIDEYNKLVLDRNRLIANSSEKNPLVVDLTASLKTLKRTILQSVDNLIVSLNTEMKSIRIQEEATTSQLASNPSQAKYLLSVERQQKVKEELYLYLLQKREENELSQAFTAYNTRVITAPRGSFAPTSPHRMRILLMALALGLLAPAGVIYLLETMNTRLRGRKDLENLSAPLVGEIPLYGTSKQKTVKSGKSMILVEEGNRNIINEAFRVLRSNMDFMASDEQRSQVCLMTSYNPGSGKSFLTANIAMSFALKGKKVIVIDGDLRHGSLSALVQSPKVGLSNYLSGRTTSWQEIQVAYPQHSNLVVIPVGTVPPNPTELLENGKLASLVAELRQEFDYIFIDCPPIDIVADTQIISKVADRTLFVLRAGLLERSMLPELEKMYQDKRFPNLAIILNATVANQGRYGYRYGYHYGYHSDSTSYYIN